MSTGKRCNSLTMKQRLDILKDLETASTASVAAKYKVHVTTIRTIKRSAVKINYLVASNKQFKHRKRLRRPTYQQVEEELLTWFIQRRTMGDILSDALLLQKATEIRDTIGCCSNFKVSAGWLTNFKKRHNIRLHHMHSEKPSADKDAATEFINKFKTLIEEEDINLENIYNMDESGLLWKALPTKTLIGSDERCVSGCKLKKERITIALCANATGTHKLDPLLIYKYKNPRALKNCMNNLPIIFKSQSNAWMNTNLFIDWYNNHFKPSVRKYQLENGLCGKTILLLNNCSSHRIPTKDEHFQIVYLPANTASLIQPMDQGIIKKVKRRFRHKMIGKVIGHENGIQEFYENYSIKTCIDMLSESWGDVTNSNIKDAWNKLLLQYANESGEEEKKNVLFCELQNTMSTISERNVDRDDTTHFLEECVQGESNFTEETIKKEPEDAAADDNDTEISNENKREMFEGPKERTTPFNSEARKELEDIFRRLEHFNSEVPRSTRLQVEAIKLIYLGEP